MKATLKTSYPLEQIRIASPCTADWNKMEGDDCSRYCGECKKNVYNLSAMSRQQAEQLMLEKEGNLCVLFYKRHDGTVLTEDCPVGWRRVAQESRRRSMLALTACVSIFASVFGIGSAKGATPTPTEVEQMGQVCVNEPTPTPNPKATPTPTPTPKIKPNTNTYVRPTMGRVAPPKIKKIDSDNPQKPVPLMGSPVPHPTPTPAPKKP